MTPEQRFKTLKYEYYTLLEQLHNVSHRLSEGYKYFAEKDKHRADYLMGEIKDFHTTVLSVIRGFDAKIEQIERMEKNKSRCPFCDSGLSDFYDSKFELYIEGNKYVDVPVLKADCPVCRETVLSLESEKLIDQIKINKCKKESE